MTPEERLQHHRAHSLPALKRLRTMCREKLEAKLVEPNGPLWEPITFIVNQWQRLTKFCEIPGVPLDTNVVEQMLIIPVRYLAGSFNYKTRTGAEVGDRHMSLIATAVTDQPRSGDDLGGDDLGSAWQSGAGRGFIVRLPREK